MDALAGSFRDVEVRRWAVSAARVLLGVVWVVAGVLKVGDLDASVRSVRAYRLLPELAAQVVGAGLPLVEVVLGALLVIGAGVRAGAALSAALLAAFMVGIASAWARGLRIECGCFGSGGNLAAGRDPTYPWELARDAGLLLLAALVIRWPVGRLAVENVLNPNRHKEMRRT